MTNFEKIKAMSIEEMAEKMSEIIRDKLYCELCPYPTSICDWLSFRSWLDYISKIRTDMIGESEMKQMIGDVNTGCMREIKKWLECSAEEYDEYIDKKVSEIEEDDLLPPDEV